jgi:hypothetical protein
LADVTLADFQFRGKPAEDVAFNQCVRVIDLYEVKPAEWLVTEHVYS